MSKVAYLDIGVGESRAALYEDDRPVEVWIERWSDATRRAMVGDRLFGIIRKHDPRSGLTFLDIGETELAVLTAQRRSGPPGAEGEGVFVQVQREAEPGKGAIVRPWEPSGPAERANKRNRNDRRHFFEGPRRLREHGAAALADRRGWKGAEVVEDASATLEVDAAVELALAVEWPLPFGGRISIETTRACVAIDVDSGSRPIASGGEARLELNLAAARSALAALRLKALGGLAVIDFVSLRRPKLRERLNQELRALSRNDPAEVVFGPVDAFDVCVLQRARSYASIASLLLDEQGAPTPETLALDGLRALQREAAAQRGRRLVLSLPPRAHAWLMAHESLGWRAALAERIGARFDIEPALNPDAAPHARTA